MSGHSSLPSRPIDSASPLRSPERDFGRRHDAPPHFNGPQSYDGGDRHWDGRREFDDRWNGDDYDRKRRRSPSPNYAHQRPRRRSPSPGRYHNATMDPASLEHLLTFKQFAEWFRASHPQTAREDDEDLRRIRNDVESGLLPKTVLIEKHGMAKRYERYKKEYTSRQLFTIYLTHRDEAWFKERYSADPEFVALRKRVNRQGRVPSVNAYVAELREGKHDEVNYDQTDDKLPKEENDGLDRALGEEPFDPLRIEVPPRPGQVFVKTVPPSTRRKDLEEVFTKHPGFQWLALSEPSAKRSFHRVGWAQYEEGVNVQEVVSTVDSSKVDNFTFHMGVNASAIVGRIRIAPPITSTLERLETDAAHARDLARMLEEDLLDEATPAPEGEESKETTEGESTEKTAEDTVPGLRERGSDAVDDVVARLLAQENLDGEDLDEEQRLKKAKITLDQYLSYLRHGLTTCYYCVVPTAFPEELQRKCVAHLRAPLEGAEPPAEEEKEGEEDRAEDKGESKEDSAEGEAQDGEAEAREGEARERREVQSKRFTFPTKSNDERWVENLDLRVRGLLEEVDVIEYGGRDIEDESKRLSAPYIKQEEAVKYRCKQCSKLFRAPEFVIKHLSSKHPEIFKDKLDEFVLFNAFVLDPQHIQPTSQTPAAVDDQLPSKSSSLPAFNPNLANPAMFNPAAANQPGFNMAMQQQMMMMMRMQMMMQGGGNVVPPAGQGQSRDFDASELPPAPPGGEDPRARKGPVSYHDLDEPGGAGDGGLPY